jgi:hypothetical protein
VAQLMAEGVPVTVPLVAVIDSVTTSRAKLAVQFLFAFIRTEPAEQSALPVQFVNLELVAGTGVKTTVFPDE